MKRSNRHDLTWLCQRYILGELIDNKPPHNLMSKSPQQTTAPITFCPTSSLSDVTSVEDDHSSVPPPNVKNDPYQSSPSQQQEPSTTDTSFWQTQKMQFQEKLRELKRRRQEIQKNSTDVITSKIAQSICTLCEQESSFSGLRYHGKTGIILVDDQASLEKESWKQIAQQIREQYPFIQLQLEIPEGMCGPLEQC